MGEENTVAGHVFISYVREDSEHVDGLCKVLSSEGLQVWRDTQNLWPGEDWRLKIRRAIRNDALAFLACFSRQSVGRIRSYHHEELVLAIEELRLRSPDQPWLIPIRFDDCQIPDREIGGGRLLTDLHQTDLFGDRYRENVDRLVAGIRRILGQFPEPLTAKDTTTEPSSPAKFVVSISGSQGIQIGDRNIQHNTFGGPMPSDSDRAAAPPARSSSAD